MDDFDLAAALLREQLKLFRTRGHQQCHSLSNGETYMLFLLEQAGGTMQPGSISEAMHVTTACVAAALRSMERKQLIIREISSLDRRYIDVAITTQGRERLACAKLKAQADLQRVLSRLEEEEARQYVTLVTRLAQVWDEDEESW
ncbi:hypothetical protein SDC9_108089 [bioreactor metagenome]|uniref:HTH marR-type domain-containing protein n=1 Tax=bioreactor metagenome TaxID=1076179 RepID=A0A645B738_9ZZZZ